MLMKEGVIVKVSHVVIISFHITSGNRVVNSNMSSFYY